MFIAQARGGIAALFIDAFPAEKVAVGHFPVAERHGDAVWRGVFSAAAVFTGAIFLFQNDTTFLCELAFPLGGR